MMDNKHRTLFLNTWHTLCLRRRKIVLLVTVVIFLGTIKLTWYEIPKQMAGTSAQMAPLIKLTYGARMCEHIGSKNSLSVDDLKTMSADEGENCKNMNFLVYECGDPLCGGVGDRQKGIVSSYLLALLTNRYFVVNIKKPCDVENFLVPAIHNWTKCKRYIEENRNSNRTQIQTYFAKFLPAIPDMNFETTWKTQIVILAQINAYAINQIRRHKYAKQRIPWMLNRTNPEVIRMILQALFKPETRLSDELNDFIYNKTKGGQKLVCSHIRVGKNPTIPNDAKFPAKRTPNVTTIFSFLDKYRDVKNYVIYIATDSDDVRQKAGRKFTNIESVSRKIVHVDRFSRKENKKEVCEGFYTALLEQYILSSCDVLIVTRSNFGVIASYLRGRSDNLFLYHQRNEVIATNLTNIQSVYGFV